MVASILIFWFFMIPKYSQQRSFLPFIPFLFQCIIFDLKRELGAQSTCILLGSM